MCNTQNPLPNVHQSLSTKNEVTQFTRLHLLNMILKAAQACDPNSNIVAPPDKKNPNTTRTTRPILSQKDAIEYNKIQAMLLVHENDIITGNVTITCNTRYLTIKKHFNTKTIMHEHFKIGLVRNNINAEKPTKLGFAK
jgi:hypothetical protein